MMSGLQTFLGKYLFSLVHWKGMLTHRFRQVHYGQFAEDAVLAQLLKGNGGFYVDVGAYHPMHYSNTYLLYKRGWRGINIDPNPASIRLFNRYRPRDININFGIAEHEGKARYFIFNHQSCNTFSLEQRDAALKKSFIKLLGEREVALRPLRSVLDEHANGRSIDLLNIDVEGMGLSVLHSIDLTRTRPAVICIEDEELDLSKDGDHGSQIYRFLRAHSYTLHSKLGLSCIYLSE